MILTCIEDNLWEDNPKESMNERADCHGDRLARDLSKAIAELEIRCTYMEMERKDKSRSIVVDKLLMGTGSPFTRRIADYRLPEKFKVPQIPTYVRDGDPLDHLENFRAHSDLDGTPNEEVCRTFLLTLSGNAHNWFKKLPPNSFDKFKELSKIFLKEFLALWTRKKPSRYLLTLHQQSNESLKEFMAGSTKRR